MIFPTKALSIRQPWAALIIIGLKDIENRGARISHRGEILIHAGLTIDEEALDALHCHRHPVTGEPLQLDAYAWDVISDLGGIIGRASIADVVDNSDSEWFTGPWGWVMASPKRMAFKPYRGMNGLFPANYDA